MLDRRSEMRTWQNKLYNLQHEAPKPHPVICKVLPKSIPEQYTCAYHGPLSRQGTEHILDGCVSGSFLIRDSQRASDAFTLAIRFDDVTKNYKLYYDTATRLHYVGEKKFESVNQLVADGLIYLYIETRGADVLKKLTEASNYEFSPYYKTRYHTVNAHPPSRSKPHEHYLVGADDSDGPSAMALTCLCVSKHSRRGGVCQSASMAAAQRRQSVDVDLYRLRSDNQQNLLLTRYINGSQTITNNDHKERIKRDQLILPEHPQQISHLKQPVDELNTPTAVPERHSPAPVANAGIGNNHDRMIKTASLSLSQQTNNDDGVEDVDEQEEEDGVLPITSFVESSSNTSSLASSSGVASLTSTHALHHASMASTLAFDFDSLTDVTRGSTGSLQLNGISTTNSSPVETAKRPIAKQKKALTSQRAYLQSPLDDEVMGEAPVGEKEHNFKVHTFRGPHWCDFCTHFIWGLVSQGVKCSDCGFQAHKRCSIRVPNDCLPDMKRLKRVFGVDLTSLVRAEKRAIPQVLVKCITELEQRGGLTMEGVFRVPGNHEVVEDFRIALDKDCEGVDLSEKRCSDLNTITSLIKSFLRQLPIPLITYDTYPEFIEVARDDLLSEERKLECLKFTLHRLPPAHYHSLRYLMGHLYRVASNQQLNMMTAENLAIVLAPTLMSSSYTDPMSCLAGAKFEQAIIERMIVEYYRLFEINDGSKEEEEEEEEEEKDSVLFHNSISTNNSDSISSSSPTITDSVHTPFF